MLEENRGVLDEGTWQIVYSFFHPEKAGTDGDGSLLSGILFDLSEPIGIAGGVSVPGTAKPEFYSGRPAYLIWTADENEDTKNYWRAQIMVATGTGIDDSIVVSITDAQGEVIDAGTLILLSSALNVSQGKAYYSLSEFQNHLSNTDVALVFPDGRRVPGTLKLGDDYL